MQSGVLRHEGVCVTRPASGHPGSGEQSWGHLDPRSLVLGVGLGRACACALCLSVGGFHASVLCTGFGHLLAQE